MRRTLGMTALLLAVLAGPALAGGFPFIRIHRSPNVLPPGPGDGWGFPNGNPNGYGEFDHGTMLPLGGDRIPEYYFPRYYSVPADQMFFPTYYNPYIMRGQRYIPYVGCGGDHPAGGPPSTPSTTPVYPYEGTVGNGPRANVPAFTGRVEASPINPGNTGLRP